METEKEAIKIWWYMNQTELTPPDQQELAEAVKLVGEIDEMMADYKQRLEKLRRANGSDINR